MSHHFFNRQSLTLGERVLAKQVQARVFLILEEVLLEHRVELITEHVEVIKLYITKRILLFVRLRLKNVSKGQGSWK